MNIANRILLSLILIVAAVAAIGMASAAAPAISSPVPYNGQGAVMLNSTLSAVVNDADNNLMDITFAIYDGSTWKTVKTYTNVANGNYTASGVGYITKSYSPYTWNITVDDHTGNIVKQSYGFTTRGLLKLKYTVNVGASNNGERQLMPLMGDINGDGKQEIVLAAGSNIRALDAKTGKLLWTVPGAEGTAIELVDLDGNGKLETLAGMDVSIDNGIMAINPDGTIRWKTYTKGLHQPMFPILAYDFDGTGHPTIYFATNDAEPDPYPQPGNDTARALTLSGKDPNYQGAMTVLDYQGHILNDTWIMKPCWGGMTLGDSNFDGNFQLYLSDRKDLYHNIPSYGLQAYDPLTLKLLWNRPDIQHSSPMAVLADVYNTGKLDVIATQITLKGPLILDPKTGNSVADFQNNGLPTHPTPTVYDIDGDTHPEIILGTSYPSNAPKNLVVFDPVLNIIKFQATLPYHTSWPPKIGDVTGDGKMDIIVAEGEQGDYWDDFPIMIFDNNYNLIDQFETTGMGAGQLSPARVFDVDGDGLNEIVVGGANGLLMVFDTQGITPTPAPRTWIQEYSEYRAGAPVYVAPPGPLAPLAKNEYPKDGSTNIALNTNLTVWVVDYQKDLSSITFELNDGGPNWQTIKTISGNKAGNYSVNVMNYIDYNSQYKWRVTTLDTLGHTMQKTFSFNTMAGASTKPVISNENPIDTSLNVSLNTTQLSFRLYDVNNYPMSYNVTTTPNIGSAQVTNAANGVYNVAINNLQANTMYTWNVAVSDGFKASYKTYTFNTIRTDLPLLNDTGFDNKADSNDLRTQGTGQDWYESRSDTANNGPSLLTLDTTNVAGNSGKKAKLATSLAGNAYLTQAFITPQSGNFSVQYDVYVDEILDIPQFDRSAIMMMGDDSDGTKGPNSAATERFVHLAFEKNGGGTSGTANLIGVDRDNNRVTLASVNLKQWYTIAVNVDVPDGYYDVYLNGAYTGRVTSRNIKTTVPYISFAEWNDGSGTYYVDNVIASASPLVITPPSACTDNDHDGFNSTGGSCGPIDCNDNNAAINPSATEVCDNVDNNCNGVIDENLARPSTNLNGLCSSNTQYCSAGTWLDTATNYLPTAEICSNGLDENCNGLVDEGCTSFNFPGYKYRKQVVISHNNVDASTSGLPVLIDITDVSLNARAQSNGNDIVFTSSDGTTRLSHEIETYNAGHLRAWVLTPLSSTTDTVLYMYYGNNTVPSQQNKNAVWDNNYQTIQHLEELSGNALDSTSKHVDGSAYGIAYGAAGKIDGAYQFNGATSRVVLPQLLGSTNAFTLEAWANPSNKQGYIISQRDGLGNGAFIQYYPAEANFQLYMNNVILKVPASMNAWHHVVATYDGTTATLYVDGINTASSVASVSWPSQQTYVGDRSALGRTYSGTLDEVRVSSTARSASYVRTEFNNQNNPSGFYTIGPEQT